ncbi:MAG TPA: hypothetical protein VFG47_14435, partial [Geminicoccaceae bacterium]|nr:hypothetical protein [Geminicoccaceae bacterium]
DRPGDVARGRRRRPRRPAYGLGALGIAALLALQGAAAAGADPEALRRAAAEGDAGALFQLADMHERGEAVGHDLAAAAALLRLAAERGHAEAQYRLGLLYAGGLGLPEDRVESHRWLSLAADADPDGTAGLLAGSLRDAVEAGMTPDELDRARQLVAGFSPAAGPAELPPPEGVAAPGGLTLAGLEPYLPRTGCGEVRAVQDDGGGFRVAGYRVEGGAEPAGDGAAYLRRHGVEVRLVELTPALCRVLDLLGDHPAKLDAELGVVLRDEGGEAQEAFEDGEYLVIELPAFAEPRYVAVDYFVHDGEVLHMYPPGGVPAAGPLPAGTRLVLGDPAAGGVVYPIAPPFGRDLVTVFVSARPLYQGRRPELEPSEDYVTFLRRRLAGAAPADAIRYRHRVVTTLPEGGAAAAGAGGRS